MLLIIAGPILGGGCTVHEVGSIGEGPPMAEATSTVPAWT